jgi:hypothetical protein
MSDDVDIRDGSGGAAPTSIGRSSTGHRGCASAALSGRSGCRRSGSRRVRSKSGADGVSDTEGEAARVEASGGNRGDPQRRQGKVHDSRKRSESPARRGDRSPDRIATTRIRRAGTPSCRREARKGERSEDPESKRRRIFTAGETPALTAVSAQRESAGRIFTSSALTHYLVFPRETTTITGSFPESGT